MRKNIVKMMKAAAAASLALSISTAFCTTKASAEEVWVGSFVITGGINESDFTYRNKVLTILSSTPLTIRNSSPNIPSNSRIVIRKDVSANITLAGVNIEKPDKGGAALDIEGNILEGSKGNVTITLKEGTKNILKGGYNSAGLQKNGQRASGTLTIKGEGFLDARGNEAAAGIGGGAVKNHAGSNARYMPDTGTNNITIQGGNIYAKGGAYGAGIGAARSSIGLYQASNITISGGVVNAVGSYGAGIGGAYDLLSNFQYGADHIRITGGTVTAHSSTGAGIGGSRAGKASDIVIDGGSVKASSDNGSAIGNGTSGHSSGKPLIPQNLAGQNVHLLVIANPEAKPVVIDGKAYEPVNHSAQDGDGNLYVYLTEESHTVQTGDQITVYDFKDGAFTEHRKTIRFDLNGAEGTIDPVAIDEMSGNLPEPEREGYLFLGWYTEAEGGDLVDANTVFNEDTVLYAHWESLWSILTIDEIEDQTYTGSPLTPAVVVKDGDEVLEQDKDYTVWYANNRNAGTGEVTVLGIGDHEGSTVQNFTILPKEVTVSGITAVDKTYDEKTSVRLDTSAAVIHGKAENDDLKVKASGEFEDEKAGENKPVNMELELIGNDAENYLLSGNTQTAYAAILKAVPELSVTAEYSPDGKFFYLNTAHKGSGIIHYESDQPDVMTIDDNGKVEVLRDGAACLTIHLEESENHTADTVEMTVEITDESVTLDHAVVHMTYGDPDFQLNLSAGTDPVDYAADESGTVSTDPDGNVHVNKAGTGTITASISAVNHVVKQIITVKAAPRPVEVTWSDASFQYDGNKHSVHAEAANTVKNDIVSFTYDHDSGTDAGTYTTAITAIDNDSYTLANAEDLALDWTIRRRNVVLTSVDTEKEYDGTPLKGSEVMINGDGFIDGQGATYQFIGSQQEPGESVNVFTYVLNPGTLSSNYNIATEFGELSVTEPDVTLVPDPSKERPATEQPAISQEKNPDNTTGNAESDGQIQTGRKEIKQKVTAGQNPESVKNATESRQNSNERTPVPDTVDSGLSRWIMILMSSAAAILLIVLRLKKR